MADLRIKASVVGLDKVTRGFSRSEKAVAKLGRTGGRVSSRLAAGFGRLRGGMSRLAGVASGLGVALGAKEILKFDDGLASLQAAMGKSTADMQAMRDQILGIQSAFGISKATILESATVFQDQGAILEKNQRVMGALAKRAKATGTPMAQLATISAALQNNLQFTPEQAISAIDTFIAQGDAGTIAMRNFANEMKPIAGIAAATGQDITKLSAAFQVIGKVAKSPEAARTQLDRLLGALKKDSARIEKLVGKGFKVTKIDPDTGQEILKDVDQILGAIFKKSGGRLTGKTGLNAFFKEENASRAASALFKSFDPATGTLGGEFGSLAGTKGSDKLIDTKLNKVVNGIAAESEKLKGALFKLESGFQKFGKQFASFAAANPLTTLAGGLAGFGAIKLGPAIIKGLLGRGRKGAGLAGGDVQKVFVVNQVGGIGGGGGGSAGRFSKLMGVAMKGAMIASAGAVGFAIGSAIDSKLGLSDKIAGVGGDISAKQAKRGKVGVGSTAERQARIREQARQLIALSGQAKTFQSREFDPATGKNKKKAFTPENIAKELSLAAERRGVADEAFLAELQNIAKQMGNQQIVVAARGLDRGDVMDARRKGAVK